MVLTFPPYMESPPILNFEFGLRHHSHFSMGGFSFTYYLKQYEFRFIFRCAAVPYEDSEKSSLTFILSVCPAEPQLLFRDFKGNARFRLRLKRHPADSLKLLCRTHDARSDIMDIHLNHFRCRIFLRSDC